MARIKQGVFSWEDVLAQRYHNNKPPTSIPRPKKHPNPSARPPTQKPDTQLAWTPQLDCGLLTRLSPELRLMIWELALGGMRIHIVQRPNRQMSHVVCPRTERCEICRGGLPSCSKRGGGSQNGVGRGGGGGRPLLALSATCRQIYTESHHLLYTLNTFEFSTTWSLSYLHPTLPASHWNLIRHVELRWAFPGHWLPSKDPVKSVYFSAGRQQWVETCAAVTRMSGLQSFTLQLSGSWFCEAVEKIPVFLEPLRGLAMRWGLQLPGQPYYVKEVRKVDGDLRKRGIECLVWAG